MAVLWALGPVSRYVNPWVLSFRPPRTAASQTARVSGSPESKSGAAGVHLPIYSHNFVVEGLLPQGCHIYIYIYIYK